MESHLPRFVKHAVEIFRQERRKLDIRAKPSMKNVLLVTSANSPLALSSLLEEMKSACVGSAMIVVMPR